MTTKHSLTTVEANKKENKNMMLGDTIKVTSKSVTILLKHTSRPQLCIPFPKVSFKMYLNKVEMHNVLLTLFIKIMAFKACIANS